MHSFQASRGRVLFEVLCALAIAASLAGAWMQTGASALLGAAGAALLYGLAHLFDMRQRRPAAEAQRIDFEAPGPAIIGPETPVVEPQPMVEAVEPIESPAPRTSAGRRKGGSRKGNGRRAKADDGANVVELVPSQEVAADVPAPAEKPGPAEAPSYEEASHAPLAPLFEPEPFVRQQRVMFGRKSR